MKEGFPGLLLGLKNEKQNQSNQKRIIYGTRLAGENAIQCTQTLS